MEADAKLASQMEAMLQGGADEEDRLIQERRRRRQEILAKHQQQQQLNGGPLSLLLHCFSRPCSHVKGSSCT